MYVEVPFTFHVSSLYESATTSCLILLYFLLRSSYCVCPKDVQHLTRQLITTGAWQKANQLSQPSIMGAFVKGQSKRPHTPRP